jgi:hypothetical protein
MTQSQRDEQGSKSGGSSSNASGPSTNSDAVPDGLEGSIMESDDTSEEQRSQRGDPREKPHGDPLRHGNTADRAEGNERRSDEN